ncbi:ferritin-like domain-containing protein [Belliella sp. DSM 111904]|uniref:Ferritin-like domain-containing protein n=1 Tax=Belliella filtrata TaxID=2923435 RepID=A0ABS9V3N2_9BACT|nr:ferritin-like domain-containing protein [Belliella filtrata]MCH7410588.1 ferritin-like domain-containing protein [Belliella filtrata]
MTNQGSDQSAKNEKSPFHQLFIRTLKDIYWAEKHLVKELPKMYEAATSNELAEGIQLHIEETYHHITRLEEVFDLLVEKHEAKKCEAMQGLLEEAKSILEENPADTIVRDAAIIIACQKVEHYEIASYGSLIALAKKMKHENIVEILEKTLDEEKNADKLLTRLAVSGINEKAIKE